MSKEVVREAVREALDSMSVEYYVEEESGAVVVPVISEKLENNLLIVFDIFEDYFMLLGIIPIQVDPEDEDEMIRFVNMVNQDIRYGRFVYDEEEMDVQYRFAYLGSRKRISRETIRAYFGTACGTVMCYAEGVLNIWQGMSAEDAYMELGLDDDEDGDGETEDVPSRAVKEKHGAGEGGSKILRPFDHIGRKS